MLPALTYKTKFGSIAQSNLGVITLTESKATIEDWILRHSGLQKTLYNLQLLSLALGTPQERQTYILWKRQHLTKIGTNSASLFRMEFERYMNAGTPENIARKRATTAADEYKKKMIEQHNKQFPDEFTYEQAIKLLRIDRDKKNKD